MRKLTYTTFAVGLMLSLAPLQSAAQPAPPPSGAAIAEAAFQEARELLKTKQFAQARAKFAESQRLDPKPGTLLNLALCDIELEMFATAWAELSSALAIAMREGQTDRIDFAREQLVVVEKRLAKVVIRVDGASPQGLAITVDGRSFDAAAMVGVPLPLDPGDHLLGASAPGKIGWSKTVSVPKEKAEIEVTVPVLQDAVVVAPPPAPGASTHGPQTPAPAADTSGVDPHFLVYGGFGVGAAGFIVGTIAGVATLSKASDLEKACNSGPCPPEQQDTIDGANNLANLSNIGFVLGFAGAAVGVVGLTLWKSDAPGETASVTAVVGPASAGLSGKF